MAVDMEAWFYPALIAPKENNGARPEGRTGGFTVALLQKSHARCSIIVRREAMYSRI
jgi:hypothetical protein